MKTLMTRTLLGAVFLIFASIIVLSTWSILSELFDGLKLSDVVRFVVFAIPVLLACAGIGTIVDKVLEGMSE